MENDTVKRQSNINYYRSSQDLNTSIAFGIQKKNCIHLLIKSWLNNNHEVYFILLS